MNTNKYNDTKKVTARQKARFMQDAKKATTKREVYDLAVELAKAVARKTALESTVKDLALALYACGLAVWNMEQAQTVGEYMTSYLRWKLTVYEKLDDKGALGDVGETIVHLLAMRKQWRTKVKNLHVSAIGKTDVVINGVRYEVGHNAKTWADSSVEDAMNGPFDGVIYGMFDVADITEIGHRMRVDLAKGVTELANLLYVFTDKADFLQVMQNDLGRSETLKYREDLGVVITVHNPSKQKAWENRMYKSEFPTLTEYMKSLGENDYLK